MSEFPTGTITFLFTDIVGSTQLWEEQRNRMAIALARHDEILREVIEGNHGRVFKTIGDAFCAAFAAAPDAVQAAVAIQERLERMMAGSEGSPDSLLLQVRIALHTGHAVLKEGDYLGPTLNRVARLVSIAHGGQVLLSAATRELVQDDLPPGTSLREMGLHQLRGLQRPERVSQLLHPGLARDFPPLSSLGSVSHNLPVQASSFVGREQEIKSLREALSGSSLVTLTGAAGVGKTRLSLKTAGELLEEYPGGVWLVELASLSDPDLVPQAAAAVLGVKEEAGHTLLESLVECCKSRKMLLLLDNFEHLISAAPFVSLLLAGCPGLKIMVTSRAPLRVQGEQEFPVPPLPLPDRRLALAMETLSQYGAVELFIRRAVAVRPDFAVTNENAPAVAEICARLEGLPLAIELAAARVRLLSPQAILARLGLKLLTGGPRDLPARQQTLRNAIAWSSDLLAPEEQKLFRRLSIFVGGCTLEAVEAVCYEEPGEASEALDQVSALAHSSLVRQQEGPGGESRFMMLETVREYSAELLAAGGEYQITAQRHADFFLALAEAAEAGLSGEKQVHWLERLEWDHDNLRAAMEWALTNSPEVSLRLTGALSTFWQVRGYLSEGRARLAAAMERAASLRRTLPGARALCGAGALAQNQGDFALAHVLLEESLKIRRELGDRRGVAASLSSLATAAYNQGDFAGARSLEEESLQLRKELGDRQGAAYSLNRLGLVAYAHSDYAIACPLLEESLAIRQELGDRRGIAASLSNLGLVLYNQGRYAEARTLHEQSLALEQELGNRWGLAISLGSLGLIANAQGDYVKARDFHKQSLALRRELGDRQGTANSLGNLGLVAHYQGDQDKARALLEESLQIRRQLGDKQGMALSLGSLGLVAFHEGDYATARTLHEESLGIRREAGLRWGTATSLANLGRLAYALGDYKSATEFHQESLEIRRRLGDRHGTAESVYEFAVLAASGSDRESAWRAARLMGAAESVQEEVGFAFPPMERAHHECCAAAVRQVLGETDFEEAFSQGQQMGMEGAFEILNRYLDLTSH